MSKLAIFAGKGHLPKILVEELRSKEEDFVLVCFEGETESQLTSGVPHFWTTLGAVGRTVENLSRENVGRVVFAGRINRPKLSNVKPDAEGMMLMGKILSGGIFGKSLGDDRLLRTITEYLESKGFGVVGVDEIINDLVAPSGVLGSVSPSVKIKDDIEFGMEVASKVGALDVGQAVVVEDGLVLGVEAAEGTDALIERCALLRKGKAGEKSGVLVKVKKPHQERRVDLPAVGPETVRRVHKAGLAGIAVEAGNTLVIDRAGMMKIADETGIFVVGINA